MAQAGDRSGRRLRAAAAGIFFVFAGTAAQAWQLELVSRVHPDQLSETGAGAEPARAAPFAYDSPSPPSISADGRYLVFVSPATNLAPGQRYLSANPRDVGKNVFLADLATGTTTLVSHLPGSPETTDAGRSTEAVLSADGRWIAFDRVVTLTAFFPTGTSQIDIQHLFLYDRASGTTTRVTQASPGFPGFFLDLALSADGRYLTFASNAPNLVPGQIRRSSLKDVFLYDRVEGTMRLVSHASSSLVTTAGGESPVISADGRYVAFLSGSGDLVPGQETGESAFLYDRVSQTVRWIGPAKAPVALSADGRYAAVAAETTTYLWDRETEARTVLSEEAGASNAAREGTPVAISADGRHVAFSAQGLFLYDRISGSTTLAGRREDSPSVPAEGTAAPAFSADGRYLAYMSSDESVVAGQTEANSLWDVFLFDRVSGTTRLLSGQGSSPETGDFPSYLPAISADGSVVAFWSDASDLLPGLEDKNQGRDVFVFETASEERSAISVRAPDLPSRSPGSSSAASSLSADGRWVAFESDATFLIPGQVDTNRGSDVFLYDRTTKTTILVSRNQGSAVTTGDGRSVRPQVSADGRYVVFDSAARDLVTGQLQENGNFDVYLFDRIAGTTRLVGRTLIPYGPDSSNAFITKEMTPDGRWVVFTSNASGLVPGQQDQGSGTFDVFLWDRVTGSTTLVSRSSAGPTVTGDGSSLSPTMSADGRFVVFESTARDLVPGQIDESSEIDLFLFDRTTGRTSLVSHAPGSAVTATGKAGAPSISANGRWIFFESSSGGVVSDGQEGGLFLYDRIRDTSERIAAGLSGRISADGKTLAFLAFPDFFVQQIWLLDRISRALTVVPEGTPPLRPRPGFENIMDFSISANGRFVAYTSDAKGLVPGLVLANPGYQGNDIYLFDRVTGTNVLASRGPASPLSALGFSEHPVLSADGRHVAFTSSAPLVADDLNLRSDAYLFTREASVSVPACTLFDSRRRQDRPILRSGVRRSVKAHGACSVPATAKSVVVKVTIVNPTGKGNVRFYPGDSTAASAGILRFERGQTRLGTFTIPLAANGAGTFAVLPQVAGNGTVHVAVEIRGYVE